MWYVCTQFCIPSRPSDGKHLRVKTVYVVVIHGTEENNKFFYFRVNLERPVKYSPTDVYFFLFFFFAHDIVEKRKIYTHVLGYGSLTYSTEESVHVMS